jgi:glycosyltransferase involved in cell wall biosynthesis
MREPLLTVGSTLQAVKKTSNMKILLITSLYPVPGETGAQGVTRALHNLVKYWNRKEGVTVRVVRPVYFYFSEWIKGKNKQTVAERKKIFSLDGVEVIVYPVYKIPKIAYFYYPLYRYLARYLEKVGFEPDLVVAHYDKSLQIGYGYAQRSSIPFVAGLHITPDLMEENPGKFTRRCGKLLEAAAAVACRSGYIYNKIQKWFPHYGDKCFVAFSGIEEDLIGSSRSAIWRMKEWKRGKTLAVISVCSLIERKKIDTNLRALALLSEEYKEKMDWNYTIIGDGEELQRLETLAMELGISYRVRFRGRLPRHEVIAAMQQTHIFVMVSELETFGLVYLEAMASGNIVIAAQGEGIDGVIRQGKNGFLSPAGDVESLKNTFETIIFKLQEEQLGKILSESFHTIEKYTDQKAADHYWQKLKNLFSAPSASSAMNRNTKPGSGD